MNTETYKKPPLEAFKAAVEGMGGNLSKVAKLLKVSRTTIWQWCKEDKEFATVVKDERSKVFDECFLTARTMALGIPAYETVLDEDGNPVRDKDGKVQKKFAGWVERPDGQMVRYLMSTIGRNEGFGDSPVDETDGTVKNGVSIKAWIIKQNEGDDSAETSV